ncbi:hypothetical protein D3C73_1588600 [compost metagenome]
MLPQLLPCFATQRVGIMPFRFEQIDPAGAGPARQQRSKNDRGMGVAGNKVGIRRLLKIGFMEK